jgi:hypothetical protein
MEHEINGLPALIVFACAGTIAGGIRVLFFGNGNLRRAAGIFLGGVFLGAVFGSAAHSVSTRHELTASVSIELGLIVVLVAAVMTPILLEWILSVGTRSLKPLETGVVGAAEWWAARIGGGNAPASSPASATLPGAIVVTTTTTPAPIPPLAIVVEGKPK